MPLGRFAAYFFLMVVIGLVAFPCAMGASPTPGGVEADVLPSACFEAPGGGINCAPPRASLGVSRHRTPPNLRQRMEAGESAPLSPEALAGVGWERRRPAS